MPALPDASSRFELVKWYLDSVEPDGTATIAYWASLTWLGAHTTWHDLSRYELGQKPAETSSRRAVPPPQMIEGHVAWHAERLHLETIHEAATPGVTLTLFEDANGRITWECLAPSARARFDRGGTSTEGTGYVECMTMTVPPWELPIDELRWGRWMNDTLTTSLVWIDWRGKLPRHWVLLNGSVQEGATVRDDGIDVPTGRLMLDPPRTLHDRSVGKLLRGISGLARVATHIPLAWDEHKWCSRGTWTNATGETLSGWSIHEMVRFT